MSLSLQYETPGLQDLSKERVQQWGKILQVISSVHVLVKIEFQAVVSYTDNQGFNIQFFKLNNFPHWFVYSGSALRSTTSMLVRMYNTKANLYKQGEQHIHNTVDVIYVA